MAYLKEIGRHCGETFCKRRAVVALYGWRNSHEEEYCRACGNRKLKELQQIERKNEDDNWSVRT